MKQVVSILALSVFMSFAVAAETTQPKNKMEISYTLPAGLPEVKESALVKSVGLPVVSKYMLDDGYGIKFRKHGLPGFSLEFRSNRVNVAWVEFGDEPKKIRRAE